MGVNDQSHTHEFPMWGSVSAATSALAPLQTFHLLTGLLSDITSALLLHRTTLPLKSPTIRLLTAKLKCFLID